ncbi:tRNA-specific adenosine deaminase [Anaerobiospirillum thomasii]|uniref:tRNA adenosine(34) deaminase TadA n=1 Tax=Anaerobiospirillum thomasii TaxID=179995 RepID=UPI000D88CCCD|nr:tRNA adenosine(34) deaminase TadA [Anaerobiospirillum thomasii]SPT68009.1 tRNA-specific adenosine deaminase [Anaerobiospirillum thomasii]
MSETAVDHEFYMRLALEQAKIAYSLGEVPVGAVIVDDKGSIIGSGMNRVITDSDPSAHAEIAAMRKAGISIGNYRLVKLNMYVTLEPCLMCTGAMIHARIDNLYFGAFDLKTGACSSVFNIINDTRHNHQIHFKGGILQSECAHMLQSFFKERRQAHRLSKSGV